MHEKIGNDKEKGRKETQKRLILITRENEEYRQMRLGTGLKLRKVVCNALDC